MHRPETPPLTSETSGRLHRCVALVGMMGSGKTAIGRSLAGVLGVPFVDSDAEIERAAQATIPEIFKRDGEAFFRDREAEVIARLLHGPPAILSTGGGAFLAQRNRDNITQHGVSVWLDVDLATLWDRVRHKSTRPLLQTHDPYETLKSILADRKDIYALADMKVSAKPSFSIAQTTQLVVETLGAAADILEI